MIYPCTGSEVHRLGRIVPYVSPVDIGIAYTSRRATNWLRANSEYASSSKVNCSPLDIFKRQTNGTSSQVAKLSVLIGAMYDDASGSAYIIERQSDGSWTQVSKLVPNDGADGEVFGAYLSTPLDPMIAQVLFIYLKEEPMETGTNR
eukprot:106720_1